jgi:hypothetical protein
LEKQKKINNNRRILKLSNDDKTIWDIIKLEIGKNFSNADVHILVIDIGYSCNQPVIADAFSNYFHSIADIFTSNNTHNTTGTNKNITSTPLIFLSQISKNSFYLMSFKVV